MDIASLVISIFAVLIALAALSVPFVIERRRNSRKLFLRGKELTRECLDDGSVFLLLQVTACNPAYIAKTIYNLAVVHPCYQTEEVLPIPDLESSLYLYNMGNKSIRAQLLEVRTTPFDIEPLHSRSVLIGLKVKLPDGQNKEGESTQYQEVSELFVAVGDQHGNPIAQWWIPLNQPPLRLRDKPLERA